MHPNFDEEGSVTLYFHPDWDLLAEGYKVQVRSLAEQTLVMSFRIQLA
jgi:hypothetical protein